MSDLMREEFEAWTANHDYLGGVALDRTISGNYADIDMQHAWQSWQASRECLVIKPEWPDRYEFTNPDVAGSAILDCRSAFQKALIAAGVKYK